MPVSIVLLGIAIFLLGILGFGFFCFYEFHDCKRLAKDFPPGLAWFLGLFSLVPLVLYLLIIIGNYKTLIGS